MYLKINGCEISCECSVGWLQAIKQLPQELQTPYPLGVCVQGRTYSLNDPAVEYAHAQGAKIIALTDSAFSPIALHADSLLLAQSDMASFVDSLVAPMSLINALIVAIARKKGSEMEQIFTRLESIWDEYEVYDKESSR